MSDDFEKKTPITRSDLVRELRGFGVQSGQVLMLHASLSSIGYVIGGADSVVLALREVLGQQGTLVALASWDHAPPDSDRGWSEPVRKAYLRDPPAFDVAVSACARYVGCLRNESGPGPVPSAATTPKRASWRSGGALGG